MKKLVVLLLIGTYSLSHAQKITYTLVALCDNKYQGIVPVPSAIGNGDDPKNNLYWGCGYGVKTFFSKSPKWELVYSAKVDSVILERLVFYNKTQHTYHVADAYRGKEIKQCTIDFFAASAGKLLRTVKIASGHTIDLQKAMLINYVGHNGLMDFTLNNYPTPLFNTNRKVSILACIANKYYQKGLQKSLATAYVWTTNYMAPEAYTLMAIIDSWLSNATGPEAKEAAAQAYNKYQKCGITGARNTFASQLP